MKNNTKAAEAPAATSVGLEISCTEFKPLTKGNLRGFATLDIAAVGLRLIECPYFEGDKGPGVGFPSRSFQKNGKTAYIRVVDAVDKIAYSRFQRAAVRAVQEYLAASRPPAVEYDAEQPAF